MYERFRNLEEIGATLPPSRLLARNNFRVARHSGRILRGGLGSFHRRLVVLPYKVVSIQSPYSFPSDEHVQAKPEQTNSSHTRGRHCGWADRILRGYRI